MTTLWTHPVPPTHMQRSIARTTHTVPVTQPTKKQVLKGTGKKNSKSTTTNSSRTRSVKGNKISNVMPVSGKFFRTAMSLRILSMLGSFMLN